MVGRVGDPLRDVSKASRQSSVVVLGAFATTGAVVAVALAVTGVSFDEAFRSALLIMIGSLGCGVVWALLRRRALDVVEVVGVGIALFSVLASICRALSAAAGEPASTWLVAAVVLAAALSWWAVAFRRRTPIVTTFRLATALPVLAALPVVLMLARTSLDQFGIGADAAFGRYNADLFFFESLSNAIERFGPGESGLLMGWPARYHWLVYGFSGAVSADAGLQPFVSLVRVVPVVATVSLAALAAAWTGQLARSRWLPAAAVTLLLLGTSIASSGNHVVNWVSPSQSLGACWLLALLLVTAAVLRRQASLAAIGVTCLLAVGCAGGKASTAAVATGALGAVAVLGLARRTAWRQRAIGILGLVVVTTAAVTGLVTAGAADSGALSLSPALLQVLGRPVEYGTPFGAVTGALTIILVGIPRSTGLIAFAGDRWVRRSARIEFALGVGAATAAVVAVVVLWDDLTSNQLWFVDAACVPLAILSALGLERVWRRLGPPTSGVWVGLWLSVAAGTVWAAAAVVVMRRSAESSSYPLGLPSDLVVVAGWLAGGTVAAMLIAAVIRAGTGHPYRRAVNASVVTLFAVTTVAFGVVSVSTLGTSAPSEGPGQAAAGDVDVDRLAPALAWLRNHAHKEDVLATTFDSRAFSGAFSGLRPYAEWELYSSRILAQGGADEYSRRLAEANSVAAGSADPSVLCAAGVSWLVVPATATQPPGLSPAVTYADGDFAVIELPC